MIPVLFTTYNRLEYSKKALQALLDAQNCAVIVIDNASTDGTVEWLKSLVNQNITIVYKQVNEGVRGAMDQFFELTKDFEWVGKVDNDTVVPKDWVEKLKQCAIDNKLDIVQAKHHIIPATHMGGWDGMVAEMKKIGEGVYGNSFVGGSGIIIRRSIIKKPLPKTMWMLGGWFDWQQAHPEVKKGFCEAVEVNLLDEKGYDDYPNYYKETKRL